MGMTERQFASYRKRELEEYEDILEIAKRTNADRELIKKIEIITEKARNDILEINKRMNSDHDLIRKLEKNIEKSKTV